MAKTLLCSWCKKAIESSNHYSIVRRVKGLPFLGKKQVWEFHSLAEIKAWAGHKPVEENGQED